MNKATRQLQKENNILDQQILAENQETFTNMICYIRSASISESAQEKVRHDLSIMILEAQERGETIEQMIGEDLKTFCDEVIANTPKLNIFQRLLSGFELFLMMISILWIITLVFSQETFLNIYRLFRGETLNPLVTIRTGQLFCFIWIALLSYGIVQFILKTSLNGNIHVLSQKKLKTFFIFWLISAIVVGIAVLVQLLSAAVAFQINFFLGLAIGAALFLIERILNELH